MEISLADLKNCFLCLCTVRFMITEKLKFSSVCETNKFADVILFPVCLCHDTSGICIYEYLTLVCALGFCGL